MRYSRQITLPEFGKKGQQKLNDASIMIIGAGGLGVPVSQYLAAAGIGKITLIDDDKIELSNLHRQVLYTESDIGQQKAIRASEKLLEMNSTIKVEAIDERLDANNALSLLEGYNVIIDCTDNFPTRYLANDAAYLLDTPLVYGAIYRYEGQVSVFNYQDGPNYRDLFPHPPNPGEVPNCAEGGVLGVLPGIIGCLMANEVLKIVTGIGDALSGKLLMFDAKSSTTQHIKFKKRKDNPISGDHPSITQLIDYEEFCGLKDQTRNYENIDAQTLHLWIKDKKNFQLIDVRDTHEYALDNLNGINIPVSKIKTEAHQIEDDIPVVIMCQTGKRSLSVLQFMKKEHDFDNLINLKGGITEYRKVIR